MKKIWIHVSLVQEQIRELLTYAPTPVSEASQWSFESLESRMVVWSKATE